MLITFELKNGIYDMLQHFGARQRSLFIDMSNDDKWHIFLLGILQNSRRTLSNLRETTNTSLNHLRANGLNTIYYDYFRLQFRDTVQDTLQRGFCHNIQIIRATRQTLSTKFKLFSTLLTTSVKGLFVPHLHKNLKRQSRFSNTRFTTQKHQTTRHQSATQHSIQFRRLHINTHLLLRTNILNTLRCTTTSDNTFLGGINSHLFLIGSPFATNRATTYHLRCFSTTGRANILDFGFGHILGSSKGFKSFNGFKGSGLDVNGSAFDC